MPAYVIADVEITDSSAYEEYKKQTPATIAAFGGKFIARGGQVEVLEGDWNPNRVVILEFESVEKAKEWWASPMYQPARDLRQRVSRGSLIVVEGVPS